MASIHFWKRLLSGDYDHALWKPVLKQVIQDKSVSWAAVASHLESIYQTRNRIAPHVPVYGRRLAQTETAIEFVARHLDARGQDGATPLERLLQPEMVELQNRAGEMRRRLDALQAGAG